MLYTAGEIVLFLVASALIGLAAGYFLWARRGSLPTGEIDSLRHQLTATRKRAATAEAEVNDQNEALTAARSRYEGQQRVIRELQVQLDAKDPALEPPDHDHSTPEVRPNPEKGTTKPPQVG